MTQGAEVPAAAQVSEIDVGAQQTAAAIQSHRRILDVYKRQGHGRSPAARDIAADRVGSRAHRRGHIPHRGTERYPA